MNAKEMVHKYGSALIGQKVLTQALGEYRGGPATIVDLGTDPNAPDIVMNVITNGWIGRIGIFDHAEIFLMSSGHSQSGEPND